MPSVAVETPSIDVEPIDIETPSIAAETPSIDVETIETPTVDVEEMIEMPATEDVAFIDEPTIEMPSVSSPKASVESPSSSSMVTSPIVASTSTTSTSNSSRPRVIYGGMDDRIRDYPIGYNPYNTLLPETPAATISSVSSYVPEAAAVSYNQEGIVRSKEYKIQLAALPDYTGGKYQEVVESMGRTIALEGVDTPSGYLTRVLVDGFYDASEAKTFLDQIKAAGFSNAFMIRYDNGVRNARTMKR